MNKSLTGLELAKTMTNPRGAKRNKYNAKATMVGSLRFHSAGEAARWQELCLLERAGQIHDLKRQVEFKLLAWTPTGPEQIGTYKADFQYRDLKTNQEITEDFKGMVTAEFNRTRRIMKANYGIEILVTRK